MESKKNSVLITGAGGLLGARVCKYFVSQGFDVGAIYRTSKNFEAKKSYRIDLVNRKEELHSIPEYEILINCAGLTDVDLNQKLPEKSWLENVVTATNLAEFAKKREMRFIHISTDHFQTAKMTLRSENDLMFATNNYGYAKLQAEKQVLQVYPRTTVLRTNFFGSENPIGKSLFDWVLSQIKSNQKIIGFDNVIFNPVSIDFLCKAIDALAKLPSQGIINVSGPHALTKFEFIELIYLMLGADVENLVKGSYRIKHSNQAVRPEYMALSHAKFVDLTGISIPTYKDMIRDELMLKSMGADQ